MGLEFSGLKSRVSDDLLSVIEDVSQPYILQGQTLISITNNTPSTMMSWRKSDDSLNKKYTKHFVDNFKVMAECG